MTSTRRLLTSLIVASCSAIAACGNLVGPGRSELEINRDKWNERGYRDYTVTMTRMCECLDVGPFGVTVLGDSIVAAVRVSDGAPARSSLPTVNKLFDFIQKAVDEHAATVRVIYDAELGYPRKVVYDFSRTVVDDEITYDLSGVAPIVTTQRNRR
jgi:hypothetical protein